MLRGATFSLHHIASATGIPRLGLVLPKRLARQAVTRNLIRRQAREAFRHRASGLPPFDLVLRLTRTPKLDAMDNAARKLSVRTEIETLLGLACDSRAGGRVGGLTG